MGLRRPRLTLALAAVAIAALGLAGIGVEGKLRSTSLSVSGTESQRGTDLLERYFGDSAPFAVLLRGPGPALDRQGPRLVAALRAQTGATTISPWDRGDVVRLRPGPRRALVLVDFHVPADEAARDAVRRLDDILAEEIARPVQATQTGFATLSRAIQEESVSSTERAELLALPFLLLVLLFVLRSPVAAAIPLLFGALTVTACRGILALVADHLPIDGFALTVCSMMGLALGVDYALLSVARFREELARSASALAAAYATRRTAGRTIAFAGATLLIAMLVILAVMPGALLVSLTVAAIVVTAVSVTVAAVVAPPLLLLLGDNVNRWHFGGRRERSRLMGLVGSALRRPRTAAALTGVALLLLAIPALATKTGPPSAAQLPASNQARQDAELVDAEFGAGWDAPFVLVAATDRGTVADPHRLRAFTRTQRRIASENGVNAVIGPAQLARRVAPLQRAGKRLLAGKGDASPARLRRLGGGLGRAAGGVGQIRGGLRQASLGAGLLATGSGRAGDGAFQIASGLERAAEGAGRATGALGRIDDASGRLSDAQRRAALGALSLKIELRELLPVVRGYALGGARNLRDHLNAAADGDPGLAPYAREADRLVETLGIARNEVQRLEGLAERLHDGQQRIAEGGGKLHRGASRLADAAAPLAAGLAQLGEGAAELAGGLGRLSGGADALQRNLASGAERSRPLQSRLRRSGTRVTTSASHLSDRLASLRRASPGLFESGYFFLSALDGSRGEPRQRAAQVIDLDRGGQAAQALVIPRSTFNTPASEELYRALQSDADELAAETGMRTAVTGGPAQLVDYDDAVVGRIPLAIAAIALVTFLVLVIVLRAVPLAALAVALNLLTVGVAFGVLTLLFGVPEGWPLGGQSYIDAIGAAGIFGIVFGLSIDYAVFLLTRMREAKVAGAANAEAISFGLERTARVITGAAGIMAVVFIAFAAAPIATISQLGIGLTVAVLLDATVVRIVLLPALMLLIGERVWWMPPALERAIPGFRTHTT